MTIIRRMELFDLPGCYRVCLRTGDSGDDASGLFRDPDLLGHVYVGPYFAQPDRLGHVLVDAAGVAGYVLGALDSVEFERWCEAGWWPRLRAAYPRRDDGGPDGDLVNTIHRPPAAPVDVARRYPSHLHIDLLPRAQGAGMGRRLLETLLDDFTAQGSPGVHLIVSSRNTRAIGFYERLGFATAAAGEGSSTMVRALGTG